MHKDNITSVSANTFLCILMTRNNGTSKYVNHRVTSDGLNCQNKPNIVCVVVLKVSMYFGSELDNHQRNAGNMSRGGILIWF